ncbi:Lrp/AsnC family transcriptional regulator [Flavihumibacter sp. ZG627]|uniref:Lrp/AsnC family transcriptional regulator n=1 Tax=Flavihumibacter sp. ZG627 TaxID=1463156 RepID=UPI000A9D7D69|nr:Lrp/AsnC family transcriptional regulator [Flavihumibacter sp. ZG627]
MNISLDHIDLQILDKMQGNARVSNADLARDLSMAPSAILERVKKLEQKDVIRRYTTSINPAALEQKLLAFIFIRTSQGFSCCSDTGNLLSAIPEVQEVHHIAGEDCFLVKVRTTDAASLMELMRTKFQQIPNIASTKTTIVLETVKEQPDIVIPKT